MPSAPSQFSETELSSALFDQPPGPVRAKVIICAAPRTGSWLLCRAMIHHGIGIPHEYFNAIHVGIIGPRLGINSLSEGVRLQSDAAGRRAYAKALVASRTVNSIFSAKIHWGQYASYLNNAEGDDFLQNAHFIHLYREDLLSQAISFHISRLTGRWGLDATATTRPAANGRFFELDLIEQLLNAVAEAETHWRLFFASNGIDPLRVSYERLTADLPGVVHSIVDRFGLDVPQGLPDYVEQRAEGARDEGVPPRSEIRAAYLNARRRVRPADRTRSAPDGGEHGSDAHAPTLALESYVHLYLAAKLKAELGHDDDDVIRAFRAAAEAAPNRAEAFHAAARFCRERCRFVEGYEFAKQALSLEQPADGVLVEPWIYDYGVLDEYAVNAYWIERYDECLMACRQIIATSTMVPPADRTRVEANAGFAEEKLQERQQT